MKYPCLTFSQRPNPESPKFCILHAPVGDVLQWSVVPQLSPGKTDGIQRARNETKVRNIKKFLDSDARNTIPTAIVVTLGAGAYSIEKGKDGTESLDIDPAKKDEIFVVDGQHRLYGLYEFNPQLMVPIVAILEATVDERAFQFVIINNKVSKVSTDHIRSLALKYSDNANSADLDGRLRAARLSLSSNLSYVGIANESNDSPFKGLISFPDTPEDNQWVVPAAIETAIGYIKSRALIQLDETDAHFDFFLTVWQAIKDTWPNAFSKDSKLLSKVGIQCMTKYTVDAIDYMVGFSDEDFSFSNKEDVTTATRRVLKFQEEIFWTSTWGMAIADTRAVREEIDEALRVIQQNIRHKQAWRTGVSLVTGTMPE
ncbi:DGQHR domain-containing protein [Ralstonia solanacearum]|uniref:DGQHR domain-containing protein n=1 Tax=Ralstonia solanacearum TaxID=305 RepID=UPI003CC5CA2A